MTSLAQQLQKLALPGVTFEAELKKRPSLLFDSQKAATLDRDAFYALGVNGFEALCSTDPSFYDEFTTLFDESAKNLERSVMQKKENDALSKLLRKFLLRATPYFQSRSTQKCLEWLVYRMKINNFNADDMLISFLPYHGTKVFVRMLQLFEPRFINKKWGSLPTDVVPSRNMILEKCLKDRGFFALICKNIVRSVSAHGNLISFAGAVRPAVNLYAVYALEAVFNLKKGQNEFLSTILPFIVSGLESSIPDFKAATYMIICLISVKMTLTEKVIDSLLDSLSDIYEKNPELECFLTIIILTHCQEKVVEFSEKCVKNFCKSESMLGHLEELHKIYDIERFLIVFMKCLISVVSAESTFQTAPTKFAEMLLSLLKSFQVSKSSQEVVIRAAIEEAYVDPGSKSSIFKVIFVMHKKYPESFTYTINTLGKMDEDGDKMKELMDSLLKSTGGEEYMDCSFLPLVLNFNSPDPSFRASAITVLGQMLESRSDLAESDFVRQVIRETLLSDNSPEVINAVLKVITTNRETFFYNEETASDALIAVTLKGRGKTEWDEVSGDALKLLMSDHFSSCSKKITYLISVTLCDALLHKVCMSEKSIELLQPKRTFFLQQNPWIVNMNWKKDVKAVIMSMIKVFKENPDLVIGLENASQKNF